MSATNDLNKADFAVLYTNIGRGHPSYLDGILRAMDDSHSSVSYFSSDVFTLSSGISLTAWKLVQKLYVWGGRGGAITALYGLLRRFTGSGEGGLLISLLGRDIKKRLGGFDRPVVVAHPILARILSGRNSIIYQHGELAAPSESMINGCRKILVPLEDTARRFEQFGIEPETLVVTGQCIENDLLFSAPTAFTDRLERMQGESPLYAALFSSGAYPANHLQQLRQAAVSLIRSGHFVFVFSGRSKKEADNLKRFFRQKDIEVGSAIDGVERLKLITSVDRWDEYRKFASIFDKLDFFVAPAHERTNWTIGLGLPQFILTPHIGSYAPLNAAIALKEETAIELDDRSEAGNLGNIVDKFRCDGRLENMARKGYGKRSLSGFNACAKTIIESFPA